MQVRVEQPWVSRDKVVFRWTQSEPNPFQRANSFFFRYEGVDLARFSTSLFYEVFLGLQLKVFAAYNKPVEVVFAEPIPKSTVEFWRAYHDADQVTITPVAEVATYSPWQSEPSAERSSTAAVFFGGGKDSTLQVCLYAELFGPSNVVAIQFVHPLWQGNEVARQNYRRQERLMLKPAREVIGVKTQCVVTDYLARFSRQGEQARPHAELYSVGSLPVLLDRRASIGTGGLTLDMYPVWRADGGGRRYRYRNSRLEVLAAQSRHYQRTLGVDLSVVNTHFPFTQLTTFHVLAARYPDAFANIVQCLSADIDERWCYECRKCGMYALYTLACGIVDPRFDFDRYLSRSRYIRHAIDYAESGVKWTDQGNAPWHPFFSEDVLYMTRCHVLAKIDLALIADRLSAESLGNLILLKTMFGNRLYPGVAVMSTKAVARVGHEVAYRIARIAGEYLPIVDDVPGPILYGDKEVTYDLDRVMPTRIAELPHLR